MKFLSKLMLSLLISKLFSSLGFCAELPKADQVLAWYIESTGGIKAYEKINNRVTKSTLEIKGQGIKLDVISYQEKPSKSYLIIDSAITGKMENGTDGSIVWEISAMSGAQVKEGKERVNLLHLSAFDRLVYWQNSLKKVETIAQENVNGKPCYKIIATPKEPELEPQTLYFDKESHLLVKLELTVENPMGTIPMVSFLSDYREVDGIKIPHKNVIEVMGQKREAIVQSIEQNVELPENRFNLPDEINKLIEKK